MGELDASLSAYELAEWIVFDALEAEAEKARAAQRRKDAEQNTKR